MYLVAAVLMLSIDSKLLVLLTALIASDTIGIGIGISISIDNSISVGIIICLVISISF